MTKRVRIWFCGTGNFAATCLSVLAGKFAVELVITSAPSRSGRGLTVRPTPVEKEAAVQKIPVAHTVDLNKDDFLLWRFRGDPPQVMLVVDFGQMVAEPYLSLDSPGCLNIHPSLLPEYRGAAPVQRAILNGDTTTGVTLFRLVRRMDAGPIALQEKVFIPENATAGEMLNLLAHRGGQIFLNALELYKEGSLTFREQPHERATFAPKIDKRETELSWERPACSVHNAVRAMNPAPGAYIIHRGKRLKIWRTERTQEEGEPGTIVRLEKGFPVAACLEGAVLLREVQREGKSRQPGDAWFRGTGLKEGDLLK
ncbi:MAG: methionyl-tRNA formyltransferase [Thermovirgaceae bacterium]